MKERQVEIGGVIYREGDPGDAVFILQEGEVEILNTPAGKIAKQLIASKVPLGISSRGVGSVDGDNYVQEDYQLICFDLVSMPSTHGAFLHESENFGEVRKVVDVSEFLEKSAHFLNKY